MEVMGIKRPFWEAHIHDEFRDLEIEGKEAEKYEPKALETYSAEMFITYGQDRCDGDLWNSFRMDFKDWTEAAFWKVPQRLRKTMKDHLTNHGLYTPNEDDRGKLIPLAKRLHTILNAESFPRFPAEIVEEYVKKNPRRFVLMQNPNYVAWLEMTTNQMLTPILQQMAGEPGQVATRVPVTLLTQMEQIRVDKGKGPMQRYQRGETVAGPSNHVEEPTSQLMERYAQALQGPQQMAYESSQDPYVQEGNAARQTNQISPETQNGIGTSIPSMHITTQVPMNMVNQTPMHQVNQPMQY
ncbi:hypothetical protein F4811DRAFT_213544 [Daldinia bambusicola]|nr:hypothetical protein F4811DRAFT_213544 [Daldinia bambusicola]